MGNPYLFKVAVQRIHPGDDCQLRIGISLESTPEVFGGLLVGDIWLDE